MRQIQQVCRPYGEKLTHKPLTNNAVLRKMQIVAIQESYGLRVEAVGKPFGPRLGAPIPLAVW